MNACQEQLTVQQAVSIEQMVLGMFEDASSNSVSVLYCSRPIAHLISWLIPTWPVVEVNRNTMYPDIQAEWDQGKFRHPLWLISLQSIKQAAGRTLHA